MERTRHPQRDGDPTEGHSDGYGTVLPRLMAELEERNDWAAHAVRHDVTLLLAPRRPGGEHAPCLVLRAPRRTKTPPGPQGRFALSVPGGRDQ